MIISYLRPTALASWLTLILFTAMTLIGPSSSAQTVPNGSRIAIVSTSSDGSLDDELAKFTNRLTQLVQQGGTVETIPDGEVNHVLRSNIQQLVAVLPALRRGQRELAQGRSLYDKLEYRSALVALASARKNLEDATPLSTAKERAEGNMYLAICYLGLNQTKRAKPAFLTALRTWPNLTLDERQFPPSVINAFKEAKSTLSRIADATLVVSTDPSAAELYLNDQLQGKTPLTLSKLPPGKYTLTVKRDDYLDETTIVSVLRKSNQKITISLKRPGSFQPPAHFGTEIVELAPGQVVTDYLEVIGRKLNADQMLVQRLAKDRSKTIYYGRLFNPQSQTYGKVYGQPVDRRFSDDNRLLAAVAKPLVPASMIEGIMGDIASRPTNNLDNPPPFATRSGSDRSFFARYGWWILGGSAALVGGGALLLASGGSGTATGSIELP